MKKSYCLVLLTIALLIVFLIACRRDFAGGIQKPEISAARNWLHTNGGNYRNETIEVLLQNGKRMKGKLNWDGAAIYPWQGKDYIDIPFEFEDHSRYVQTGEDSALAKFNLVLRKNGDDFEGALRNTMYGINSESTNNTTARKVVQMYQLLDGRPANIWLSNQALEVPVAARTENISATEFANRKLEAAKKINLSGIKPGDKLMLAQPCTTTHIVTFSGNCNYIVGDEVYVRLCQHDYYITTCEADGPADPGTATGGGGGGESYPPDPSDIPPPDEAPKLDPCKEAKKKADTLAKALNDPTIKAHFDQFITTYKNSTIENGFAIIKNADGKYSYTATVNSGASDHISWTFTGNPDIVALIHVHPPGRSAVPSPTDIFGLNEFKNASFMGDIVISGDDKYLISVTDANKYAGFVGKKNEYYDVSTQSQWKDKSKIYYGYIDFIENAKGVYTEGTDLAFPAQLYLMKEFNMGVSLQKWDGTAFKTIVTNAKENTSTGSSSTVGGGGNAINSRYTSITVEPGC